MSFHNSRSGREIDTRQLTLQRACGRGPTVTGLRILSWNVNGLRAAAKKGFSDWLEQSEGDFVGLQETRATVEQLDESLHSPAGWSSDFVSAERLGYSGVAAFSRKPAEKIEHSLGDESFDVEGRFQLLKFGRLFIANVYFPNGNGKNRDNSRVPYKLDFYRAVFELIEKKRKRGYRVLVMGDFNTAHKDIDLARPKQNQKTSGFLPEEREELDRWIQAGWIDTLREFSQDEGQYSWWSQRSGARERNVGWRIDYILASPSMKPFLKNAFICRDVMGSDHCPVGVEIDEAAMD